MLNFGLNLGGCVFRWLAMPGDELVADEDTIIWSFTPPQPPEHFEGSYIVYSDMEKKIYMQEISQSTDTLSGRAIQ